MALNVKNGASDLARLLKAAGNESRLRILCLMGRKRGLCVSELSDELGLSVAVVSHHMRALARAGVLTADKNGKRVCYRFGRKGMGKELQALVCKYI
ncbi:MAG: winged helix-turn-helix transcriptional regulator [Patescibacteria group bacterium]|nr:winged helix-turn-helix transcriptional regulator [Patescibacteria group bacterium]